MRSRLLLARSRDLLRKCQACVHSDNTTRISYIVLPLLCTALYFARYIKWARVGACRAHPSVHVLPISPIVAR